MHFVLQFHGLVDRPVAAVVGVEDHRPGAIPSAVVDEVAVGGLDGDIAVAKCLFALGAGSFAL